MYKGDKNLSKAKSRYLVAKNQINEGIVSLNALMQENNDDDEILIILGKAYYLNKQFREALNIYKLLIEKNQRVEEATSNIITILCDIKRYSEAENFANMQKQDIKEAICVRRAQAYLELKQENYICYVVK